ncbi:hypothetical protein [Spiroplasma endosymbiont of Dilophus febrilis]|uniref:hypothetical protein n=1 Tax=Spiroplasma endosymbiont of Dilophus febrilis TaxID=3066292 RepID=UPI00313AD505
MFMKIFTVIIISFNNIFTIPQNINNDGITTQSLIRNKRENSQISEINLEKAEFLIWKNENPYKPASTWKTELQFLLNDIEKQSGIKPINPVEELWNNKGRIQSYINQNQINIIKKLNELQINTKWTEVEKEQKQNIKIKNIKVKFEYQKDTFAGARWNWWKILEFDAKSETKPSTDIELPTTNTKFDGNHNYNDVIDSIDYLMIHRGDFDKFNYSYLYWTPIFNFVDTLEKGYYKEFTIKNHGFKNESYFYHKTSSSEDKINENVLKIKAFNKTLIAGNNYLQLLHGEGRV